MLSVIKGLIQEVKALFQPERVDIQEKRKPTMSVDEMLYFFNAGIVKTDTKVDEDMKHALLMMYREGFKENVGFVPENLDVDDNGRAVLLEEKK